jgi:hypothetical protein
MTTTLEKITAREQQIASSTDALRAQIHTLTEQLRELNAEAGDLAVARKVILALGQDDPPPAALPDNPVYQHVLTVLTDAKNPLRARDLCRALDLGTEPSKVEGMRSKLKRLVANGLVTENEPGLFVLTRPPADD